MRLLPILALSALCSTSPLAGAPPAPPAASVGQIAFANSGSAEAQVPFLRGLALLHNFEYAAAAEAFRAAQKADPAFALAYWGEAMSYNHPVWMEQDLPAARLVLSRLAPTGDARLGKARSARERAYLEAVEILYGEGGKEDRDRAYSARMASLFAAHPDDVDARAFYALSLLGLAHQGRDYTLYMRAAGLLEEVYPDNQGHPGVLHYLIHSYDDPIHAPLGVRAARRYGKVAPEAGHALHMTSHIFLALGQWDEVEKVNVQAMEVVNRQRAAAGKAPVHCGHYPQWLVYARLEKGLDSSADIRSRMEDVKLELAGTTAYTTLELGRSAMLSWADMAVRRLIQTGRWDDTPPSLPEGRYLGSRFTLLYGDLLAGAGDQARVRAARSQLEAVAAALDKARVEGGETSVEAPQRERVILMQAAGLERIAAGDRPGGDCGAAKGCRGRGFHARRLRSALGGETELGAAWRRVARRRRFRGGRQSLSSGARRGAQSPAVGERPGARAKPAPKLSKSRIKRGERPPGQRSVGLRTPCRRRSSGRDRAAAGHIAG